MNQQEIDQAISEIIDNEPMAQSIDAYRQADEDMFLARHDSDFFPNFCRQ